MYNHYNIIYSTNNYYKYFIYLLKKITVTSIKRTLTQSNLTL